MKTYDCPTCDQPVGVCHDGTCCLCGQALEEPKRPATYRDAVAMLLSFALFGYVIYWIATHEGAFDWSASLASVGGECAPSTPSSWAAPRAASGPGCSPSSGSSARWVDRGDLAPPTRPTRPPPRPSSGGAGPAAA